MSSDVKTKQGHCWFKVTDTLTLAGHKTLAHHKFLFIIQATILACVLKKMWVSARNSGYFPVIEMHALLNEENFVFLALVVHRLQTLY